MSWSAQETERLLAALTDLRAAVADARLPLDTGDAEAARALARRVREQLDDHLLPRVRQLGAPLLAVVGGSTGAGKSTLVNSLLRAEVSPSGVIRPTTREPVLVHHPDEGAWFAGDRVDNRRRPCCRGRKVRAPQGGMLDNVQSARAEG